MDVRESSHWRKESVRLWDRDELKSWVSQSFPAGVVSFLYDNNYTGEKLANVRAEDLATAFHEHKLQTVFAYGLHSQFQKLLQLSADRLSVALVFRSQFPWKYEMEPAWVVVAHALLALVLVIAPILFPFLAARFWANDEWAESWRAVGYTGVGSVLTAALLFTRDRVMNREVANWIWMILFYSLSIGAVALLLVTVLDTWGHAEMNLCAALLIPLLLTLAAFQVEDIVIPVRAFTHGRFATLKASTSAMTVPGTGGTVSVEAVPLVPLVPPPSAMHPLSASSTSAAAAPDLANPETAVGSFGGGGGGGGGVQPVRQTQVLVTTGPNDPELNPTFARHPHFPFASPSSSSSAATTSATTSAHTSSSPPVMSALQQPIPLDQPASAIHIQPVTTMVSQAPLPLQHHAHPAASPASSSTPGPSRVIPIQGRNATGDEDLNV